MATGRKGALSGIAILVLLLAIVAFEIFNFDTTKVVLEQIFGTSMFWGITVAAWLAIGACAMDLGGLSRVVTTETSFKSESTDIKAITLAWFVAAGFNAFLTWWYVMVSLEYGNGVMPSVLRGNNIWLAAGIALFVFLVRFLLIFGFATVGDKFSFKLPKLNLKKGRQTTVRTAPPSGLNFNDLTMPPPKKVG